MGTCVEVLPRRFYLACLKWIFIYFHAYCIDTDSLKIKRYVQGKSLFMIPHCKTTRGDGGCSYSVGAGGTMVLALTGGMTTGLCLCVKTTITCSCNIFKLKIFLKTLKCEMWCNVRALRDVYSLLYWPAVISLLGAFIFSMTPYEMKSKFLICLLKITNSWKTKQMYEMHWETFLALRRSFSAIQNRLHCDITDYHLYLLSR